MKLNNLTTFEDPVRLLNLTAEESGRKEPNGANAESGPTPTNPSGFGGLGVEGIVGMEEPVGEGTTPPESKDVNKSINTQQQQQKKKNKKNTN